MRQVLWKAAILVALASLMTGCFLFQTPSTDATLESLGIEGYTLDKAFDPAVTEYTVLVPFSVAQVTLNAELASDLARLSFNVPDKDAIPVAVGPTLVTVTVGAEDQKTTKTYTIEVYRCNTTVQVDDSINGSLLPAAGITWKVYDGATLLETFVATANPQYIYIEPGKERKLEVSVAGRASSAREGIVVAAGENRLDRFVSQIRGMSTFPAEAPVLGSLEFTMAADPLDAAAAWHPIHEGDSIFMTGITAMRATVTARSAIEPTYFFSGAIILGVDFIPSGTQPGWLSFHRTTAYDADKDLFTAVAYFDCKNVQFTTGAHQFNLVVYDRANNRLERRYGITVTSTPTTGADLSGAYFQSLSAYNRTYGLSREFFSALPEAMPVLGTGGTSCLPSVSFKIQDAASGGNAVPILGYKVYRSSDSVTFAQVGVMNYGTLTTSSSHLFYDMDSTLEVGHDYWYKVVAFTDNTHTKESAVMATTLLPPFTTSLVAPTHGSTIDAAVAPPDYSFRVSDASVLSSAVADRLYFALALSQKDGTFIFFGEFYYRFGNAGTGVPPALFSRYRTGSFYDVVLRDGGSLSDYILVDGDTITIKSALLYDKTNTFIHNNIEYEPGVTYIWDFFGSYASGTFGYSSSMNPVYLQKTFTNGVSRSYADISQKGNQTLNGWYEFTVQ